VAVAAVAQVPAAPVFRLVDVQVVRPRRAIRNVNCLSPCPWL